MTCWKELFSTLRFVALEFALLGAIPLFVTWRVTRFAAPPSEIVRPLPQTLLALWLSGSAACTTAVGGVIVAVVAYDDLRHRGFYFPDWYPFQLPPDYEFRAMVALFASIAGLAAFAFGEMLFSQSARPVRSLLVSVGCALAMASPLIVRANWTLIGLAAPMAASVGHYFARVSAVSLPAESEG